MKDEVDLRLVKRSRALYITENERKNESKEVSNEYEKAVVNIYLRNGYKWRRIFSDNKSKGRPVGNVERRMCGG